MSTDFPTALDSFANPTPADDLDTYPHSAMHSDEQDAIEALQAKVGIDGSAVTASHDYRLSVANAWTGIGTFANLRRGEGSPESAVTAGPGALYQQTDGGRIWVKRTGTGNTGWAPVFPGLRIPHTWTVMGDVNVPDGQDDFLPPFPVPVPAGQAVALVGLRRRINAGTSATVKVTRNGSDVTGLTALSATSSWQTTTITPVALSDMDSLALVVTAVSGDPKNMSAAVLLDYGAA